jgi:hypothetical protein
MRRVLLERTTVTVCLWIATVAGILTLQQPLNAQTKAPFGTCAYWNEEKSRTDIGDAKEFYRIGLSHGFALGIGAHSQNFIAGFSEFTSARFLDMYTRGYVAVLERPAILMDAFDTKCADYRNVKIQLTDLGLIIMVEIGGGEAAQVEKALEILRASVLDSLVETRRAVVKVFAAQ